MMDNRNQALPKGTILRGKVYTYRIEKVLGQGTFGITYLASTSMHGPLGEVTVQVAVKEFFAKELDSRLADGTVTARTENGVAHKYAKAFLRESENLSKMKHPGIVNVLESFEDKGTCYYSMEYLSGGSLDDKVKDTGLPEDEALLLIERIGDALSYMHERKVMHLDLKPKNVMLKADGSPVIIDFGISKQYDGNGEPESSTTIGLGTPGYAPIEQATQTSGRTFQPTLDIYAFGATSFKMLTGNTPPNATEIFNEGFPEDLLQQKNVSSKTIKAIRKAMSAAKKDRPQSVDDYLTLLKEKSPDSADSPAWFGLNAGTKLQNGKYEIIRILGQNELETTYLAKRISNHHRVVIREFYDKNEYARVCSTGDVLYDDGTVLRLCDESNDFYKKFIREAQILAGLKHRNLVNVHEVFNEKGTAYYVMDYLPGGSLEDAVKKNGPMSEKLAEKYVRQISDALAFLHARDMVLLNVEPAHILLNAKGEAVIINPNLTIFKAKSLLNSDEGIEMPASTPHPFQGIEYPINERPSADIYSLGTTLYFLLSGVIPPYPYDVFDKGLERPEGISERMWCAIEKAMQPNPQDRPQAISEFLSLLGDDQDRTIHQPIPKPVLESKPTPQLKLTAKKKSGPKYDSDNKSEGESRLLLTIILNLLWLTALAIRLFIRCS